IHATYLFFPALKRCKHHFTSRCACRLITRRIFPVKRALRPLGLSHVSIQTPAPQLRTLCKVEEMAFLQEPFTWAHAITPVLLIVEVDGVPASGFAVQDVDSA